MKSTVSANNFSSQLNTEQLLFALPNQTKILPDLNCSVFLFYFLLCFLPTWEGTPMFQCKNIKN